MSDLTLPPNEQLNTEQSLGHVFKLLKPLTANVDLVEFEINQPGQAYQAFLLKRKGAYQGVIIDQGESNLLFLLTAQARQHINLAGFLSRLVLPYLLQERQQQHLLCRTQAQADSLYQGFCELGLVCDYNAAGCADEVMGLTIPAQAGLIYQSQSCSDEIFQQAIADLALQQQSLQLLYQQLAHLLPQPSEAAVLEKLSEQQLLAYLEELFRGAI